MGMASNIKLLMCSVLIELINITKSKYRNNITECLLILRLNDLENNNGIVDSINKAMEIPPLIECATITEKLHSKYNDTKTRRYANVLPQFVLVDCITLNNIIYWIYLIF